MERRGKRVAEVSKKWIAIRDTYTVEIAGGEDEALILALTVIVRADVPGVNMKSRWSELMDWVDAADPGALRRRHAARAALAALSVWLFMRVVNGLFADGRMPSASLYAVTVCFIGSLVIVDPLREKKDA